MMSKLDVDQTNWYNHYDKELAKEFQTRLIKSGAMQVDQFLHQLSKHGEAGRPLVTAGTQLIAEIIGRAEYDSVSTNAIREDFSDWFRPLFSKMNERCHTQDLFKSNKVRFWTFNYDRLLENLFLDAFQENFRMNRCDAWLYLKHFSFRHVHGTLGNLCNDKGADEIPFGYLGRDRQQDGSLARQAAKTIKCAHEVAMSESTKAEVNELLEWAGSPPRVVFLGFGFDPENLEKTGLRFIRAGEVWATTRGLAESNPNHPTRIIDCLRRREYVPIKNEKNEVIQTLDGPTYRSFQSIEDLLDNLPA